MHAKLCSIWGALCLHTMLSGMQAPHTKTESLAFYKQHLAGNIQVQQAKKALSCLKTDKLVTIYNDAQKDLYQETLRRLELLYSTSEDLSVRCDAAFVLGENYFHGYTTHIAAPETGASNMKKAFAYLSFLVNQPDIHAQQQAQAHVMLGKIYTKGIRSNCCGWKVPVDLDEARYCFECAQLLTDDSHIKEQADQELKLLSALEQD